MQVDPIKLTLQAPGTRLLKLKHDEPLSSFAFKLHLRRYDVVIHKCHVNKLNIYNQVGPSEYSSVDNAELQRPQQSVMVLATSSTATASTT